MRGPRRSSGSLIAFVALAFLATSPVAGTGERPLTVGIAPSVLESGLMEVLVPRFEQLSRLTVMTVPVTPGGVVALAEGGEVDLLLPDSPAEEAKLLRAGLGTRRVTVMGSGLLVVGPPADPARIRGQGPSKAFAALGRAGAPFVSPGDQSGIHQRELAIWRRVGIVPKGPWYLEAGQGMASVLRLASEKKGYALTDRATYLRLRDTLGLSVLVQGPKVLWQRYSVIEVNPARNPRVQAEGARAFADFLLSPEGQGLIRTFGIDRYGEPVFVPERRR